MLSRWKREHLERLDGVDQKNGGGEPAIAQGIGYSPGAVRHFKKRHNPTFNGKVPQGDCCTGSVEMPEADREGWKAGIPAPLLFHGSTR